MTYSYYILPGFHFEIHHRGYYRLSKEINFCLDLDQRYKLKKIIQRRKRIAEFIIDESLLIKAGNEYVWLLWIAVKPASKTVLGIRISFERNMLIAELFLQF
jgi:hypothetical protein